MKEENMTGAWMIPTINSYLDKLNFTEWGDFIWKKILPKLVTIKVYFLIFLFLSQLNKIVCVQLSQSIAPF